MMPAVEDELVHEAVADQLHKAINELGPKERLVMRMRFGLEGGEPQTLQEIGDRLKLSRERVRQIESPRQGEAAASVRLQGMKSALN